MCITEFLYNVAEGQIASCEIDNEPRAATRNSPDAAELGRDVLQVNLQLNNERNGKYENAKMQREMAKMQKWTWYAKDDRGRGAPREIED